MRKKNMMGKRKRISEEMPYEQYVILKRQAGRQTKVK